MRKEIKTMCNQVYEDIQNLREKEQNPEKRLGVEIMALNALSNAYGKLVGAIPVPLYGAGLNFNTNAEKEEPDRAFPVNVNGERLKKVSKKNFNLR